MRLAGSGIVCPVGLSSDAACAAFRSGISGYREQPYWDCENLPVIGADVPRLGDLQFVPRLTAMLTAALRECLSRVRLSSFERTPLILCLPDSERPGVPDDLRFSIVPTVQSTLGVRFHPQLSQIISDGHAGAFAGLQIGRTLLEESSIPAFVLCGVDSFINASAIHWLDGVYRLKRENQMDGVVPGEAAAAIYVERSRNQPGEVQIAGLGFGREQAILLSEEPLLGCGLATAAQDALTDADWTFRQVDFRLSDVTGETYGFREHTLAEARLVREVRIEPQPLWHPAEFVGDTGAAAGVLQLAWVASGFAKGYAPGPRALCFTSALSGERSVAAVFHWMNTSIHGGRG